MSDAEIIDWLQSHPDNALKMMRWKGNVVWWVGDDEDSHPTIRAAVEAAAKR